MSFIGGAVGAVEWMRNAILSPIQGLFSPNHIAGTQSSTNSHNSAMIDTIQALGIQSESPIIIEPMGNYIHDDDERSFSNNNDDNNNYNNNEHEYEYDKDDDVDEGTVIDEEEIEVDEEKDDNDDAEGRDISADCSFGAPTPLGEPIHIDNEAGKSFYSSLQWMGFTVVIGSFIKCTLHEENKNTNKKKKKNNDNQSDLKHAEGRAIAVVTAIFTDENQDEYGDTGALFCQVKWFTKPEELVLSKKKRNSIRWQVNELVELELLNDIPAAAILSLVNIAAPDELPPPLDSSHHRDTLTPDSIYDWNDFICRFLFSETMLSLHAISPKESCQRGRTSSAYGDIYASTSQDRVEDFAVASDVYAAAIRTLDVSVLPAHLPCRDAERNGMLAYVKHAVNNRGGVQPMYVSGLPGTGKTASVLSVVEALKGAKGVRPFTFVLINCLKLKAANDAYSFLWKALSGTHLGPVSAIKKLDHHFSALRNSSGQQGSTAVSGAQTVVCLVDEIDYLLTSSQSVMYNVLDWPSVSGSQLVVLGLANTMNLPERLNTKNSSRLGSFPDRMIFKPYTVDQISTILEARMGELRVFDSKGLKLLTRKAATVAGDLRAALRICQRAIEMHRASLSPAELAGPTVLVPVTMVHMAASEYKQTPLMALTRHSCQLHKAIFTSIVVDNRAHGGSLYVSTEELFSRLQDTVANLRSHPDFELTLPPYCVYLDSIQRMLDEGLLDEEHDKATRAVGGKAKHAQQTHCVRRVKARLEAADIQSALRGECFEKIL